MATKTKKKATKPATKTATKKSAPVKVAKKKAPETKAPTKKKARFASVRQFCLEGSDWHLATVKLDPVVNGVDVATLSTESIKAMQTLLHCAASDTLPKGATPFERNAVVDIMYAREAPGKETDICLRVLKASGGATTMPKTKQTLARLTYAGFLLPEGAHIGGQCVAKLGKSGYTITRKK